MGANPTAKITKNTVSNFIEEPRIALSLYADQPRNQVPGVYEWPGFAREHTPPATEVENAL